MELSDQSGELLFEKLMSDNALILTAMKQGIDSACLRNNALGVPMVVWENGRIREVEVAPPASQSLFFRKNESLG